MASRLTRKDQDELAETRAEREGRQPYAAEVEDRHEEKTHRDHHAREGVRRERAPSGKAPR